MKVKRPFLTATIVILLILLVAAVTYAVRMKPTIELGVGYGAHVVCSCRYIGGRDMESCYNDYEPGMEMISVAEDEENKRITASVPLLASRSAQFREGLGCVLEPLP
ncbi:hypothetical protein [Parasphingopyxis lamellibrachiae]|uniref:Uncharacterized protein n=1 Tax=Parasphingopyxis lamellibrachiae TaxID=680125 RepID=A0A3D9FKK1_9SPHN|nr:hypothetical protein [Parasphingopyxis lamellibrachiae]RED17646.1 hypothetical protein DFR46_2697 [Parasphingopyxis lamellibrachiae]